LSQSTTTVRDAVHPAEQARLRSFQKPQQGRAIWQIVSTYGSYVLLTAAMYVTAKISVLLTLLLGLPLAGLIVRIFVFQHDFGHNSFLSTPRQNRFMGRVSSFVTMTPFAYWRWIHAQHHNVWNNLGHRGIPSELYTDCLTLAEYKNLSRSKKFMYRFSHNPLLIHVLLPPVLFLLIYRTPYDLPASRQAERRSVYALDLVLLLVYGSLIATFGIKTVLLVHLPSMVLAAIIGVWLFSVQHRFEASKWLSKADWTTADAALGGTSYFKLPRLFRWFSADIGTHHVHHLRPSVPSYRLVECHEACQLTMARVHTLTIGEALRAPSYSLWDEDRQTMVQIPKG
jgi:omega-6 fatty acid desaturase (delta-12 desaturase)